MYNNSINYFNKQLFYNKIQSEIPAIRMITIKLQMSLCL